MHKDTRPRAGQALRMVGRAAQREKCAEKCPADQKQGQRAYPTSRELASCMQGLVRIALDGPVLGLATAPITSRASSSATP